jgi:hypothetical protein
LQKILLLPRRCCFEIALPKMSPLIRLHRSNNFKHTIHHQSSRENFLSRNKLQCRDSGLVQSAVERELVLRLASVLWRLCRAIGIETALFDSVTAEPGTVEHGPSRPTLIEAADLSDRNQLHLLVTRQSDVAAGNELSFNTKKDIADSFLCLAALPTVALDRLSRYEHLLWRQGRQIMFTLESLRRRKRAPSRSSFPFSFRRRAPGPL